jgi:FO synthase
MQQTERVTRPWWSASGSFRRGNYCHFRIIHRGPRHLIGQIARISRSELNCSTQTAKLVERLSISSLGRDATAGDVLDFLGEYSLEELVEMSGELRDCLPHGDRITFSPKVFIPVTRLCRDSCSYCTFVKEPEIGRNSYMTIEEVIQVARLGELQGCTEALLTLGDKPELKYQEAVEELHSLGFQSTIEYVKACAEAILRDTSLVPHVNPGVMTEAELLELRKVSGSMGLMLESMSTMLKEKGMPHYDCPDKDPAKRLEVLELAGKHRIPFTTGLLVGIGDTKLERIDGLLKVRDLHDRYGHIQEIIIQNFVPKQNTAMRLVPGATLEEMLFTVSACRLLMPSQNIQVPPNLLHDWNSLLAAGINDFGGISPGVTPDFISPEKPWPTISSLSKSVSKLGKTLLPRTCVYPEYIRDYNKCVEWLSFDLKASPLASILSLVDGDGYVRASPWFAGKLVDDPPRKLDKKFGEQRQTSGLMKKVPAVPLMKITKKNASAIQRARNGSITGCSVPHNKLTVEDLARKSTSGEGFSVEEIERMFRATGEDFQVVIQAADAVRQKVCGDKVSFVVNRNINYTNICEYGCKFCAFSKGSKAEDLRGASYLLDEGEIMERVQEAASNGATEVCMQGGIHPKFTGEDYLRILKATKRACPHIHVHAFSPLEITHGASTLNISKRNFLTRLRDAGLGSLPGTAAEVLTDSVRQTLCPDKLSTEEWVHVIKTAHSVGLKTTSTIMFGHIEKYTDWAKHLLLLRDIQIETSGITEFVPLPFVHMEAPIYRSGMSRAGPTLTEAFLMHAVSRLVLSPYIRNIQASWVKMGPDLASDLLLAGCNDMGGTLMNESITRAAGAEHGQLVSSNDMIELIERAGRVPYQRNTIYDEILEPTDIVV